MNSTKNIFLVFFLSGIITATTAQQKNVVPPGLDSYISRVLQTFDVPGMAVSIVKDGKVLLAKGYGVKELGGNAPVDENTMFLIASNTKAFTATALAMLVEEKKIKWEDPVINYIPWFRTSDPYVTMHLTVRDILVHHSGIPAYAGDLMLFPPSVYNRRQILEKLKYIPIVHDFRTVYAYDNILYLAAAEVISAVSGMEWEEFIKTRIFDKAGMTHSLSRYSDLSDSMNRASAHSFFHGSLRLIDHRKNIGDAGDPVGGIVSTSSDMAKWLITQLDSGKTPSGERIFNPVSTRELWKIVRPIPVSKVSPYIKPAQQDFFGYALGFRTYNYGKYKVVGHGGKLEGFVSQVAMVPGLNLGIAVLTNQESSEAYWSVIYHVLDYYMKNQAFDWLAGYKKIYDADLAELKADQEKSLVKKTDTAAAGIPAEKYAGTYRDDILGNITIKKEEKGMVMRFVNNLNFVADLEPFQYNTLIAKFRDSDMKADAYVSFALNADGSVERIKMRLIDPASLLDFDDLLLKPVKEDGK